MVLKDFLKGILILSIESNFGFVGHKRMHVRIKTTSKWTKNKYFEFRNANLIFDLPFNEHYISTNICTRGKLKSKKITVKVQVAVAKS